MQGGRKECVSVTLCGRPDVLVPALGPRPRLVCSLGRTEAVGEAQAPEHQGDGGVRVLL